MHAPKHTHRVQPNGWTPAATASQARSATPRLRRGEISPGLRLFSFAVTQAQWRFIRKNLIKLAADTNRGLNELLIEGLEDVVLKYSQMPKEADKGRVVA